MKLEKWSVIVGFLSSAVVLTYFSMKIYDRHIEKKKAKENGTV